MQLKTTLCALVTAATVQLVGCSDRSAEKVQRDITIYGKPISVAYFPRHFAGFTGVFEVDGKYLFVFNSISNQSEREYLFDFEIAKAAAVVQSEINDGDSELVKLTGQNRGNEFELSSIEANGYRIDF